MKLSNWRRAVACLPFGHAHFPAGFILKRVPDGTFDYRFRATVIEPCQRCDHERRTEWAEDVTLDEITSMFDFERVEGRAEEAPLLTVSLDGRPMGHLTQLAPDVWRSENCDNEIKLHSGTKAEAASSLW